MIGDCHIDIAQVYTWCDGWNVDFVQLQRGSRQGPSTMKPPLCPARKTRLAARRDMLAASEAHRRQHSRVEATRLGADG
jgi:hypothetical protein